MTNKTKQELIEQIKIMNHNYSVIREQKENGYRYSIARIKELEKELADTKEKLDYAITMLERIAVSPETMLEPEKIIPQLAAQAIEQINKKEEK